MEPEFMERNTLLLAGIVDCGNSVADIDIHGLWRIYDLTQSDIENRIEGNWYELHIGKEKGNGLYSVTVGVEVSKIEALPVEVVIRIVPGGKYAHFEHSMKDGGFSDAFAKVEAWAKEKNSRSIDFGLQRFDKTFDVDKGESVLHIYIPVVD